jgi:hypothetical protein
MTAHRVVLVVFDPKQTSYDELLRIFWENHDPTQGMRQGNDVGTQYRSAIYTFSPEQQRAAEASRAAYQDRLTEAGTAASAPRSRKRRRFITPRTTISNTWPRIRVVIAESAERASPARWVSNADSNGIIHAMSRVVYANTPSTADQHTLRESGGVRLVTDSEEGAGVNALPDGVYGYTYSPGLPNAPLFATRRFAATRFTKWTARCSSWVSSASRRRATCRPPRPM